MYRTGPPHIALAHLMQIQGARFSTTPRGVYVHEKGATLLPIPEATEEALA